jgi:hypothetical protein
MVAFVVYTAVILVPERRMRQTGGPGIISFERAGNASRAVDMMTRWCSVSVHSRRAQIAALIFTVLAGVVGYVAADRAGADV